MDDFNCNELADPDTQLAPGFGDSALCKILGVGPLDSEVSSSATALEQERSPDSTPMPVASVHSDLLPPPPLLELFV